MRIGAICNRETVVVEAGEHIVEAARLLAVHHVGCLVVVRRAGDEGDLSMPVGIVTDRDITLRAVADGVERIAARTVGDIMTRELLTAREDEDLYSALKQMRSRGVRRLPVVDDAGSLCGILAYDDAIEWVAEELWDLTRLVGRERQRERQRTSRPPTH